MRVGTLLLGDKPLSFVSEAKYLMGVCLLSGSKFKVSLHHIKRNFFRSFNSVYQKCCRPNREAVVLQLVNSYCVKGSNLDFISEMYLSDILLRLRLPLDNTDSARS